MVVTFLLVTPPRAAAQTPSSSAPGASTQSPVPNTPSTPLDDTIDPAESRYWLANLLASLRPPAPREGKKRPCIDGW